MSSGTGVSVRLPCTAHRQRTPEDSAVPTPGADAASVKEERRAERRSPLLLVLLGAAFAQDGLAELGSQARGGIAEQGRQTHDGLVTGLALVAGAIVLAALLSRR